VCADVRSASSFTTLRQKLKTRFFGGNLIQTLFYNYVAIVVLEVTKYFSNVNLRISFTVKIAVASRSSIFFWKILLCQKISNASFVNAIKELFKVRQAWLFNSVTMMSGWTNFFLYNNYCTGTVLPDQQSGIHFLIICAIQLLTPNNLRGTWRGICSPDIRNVYLLTYFINFRYRHSVYRHQDTDWLCDAPSVFI